MFVFSQAKMLLQCQLIGFFTLHGFQMVVFYQCSIGFRAPHSIVHAIQNAAQTAFCLAGLQQALQAAGGRLAGDFRCISGADGGDVVGIIQAGFQKRDLVVEFQPVHMIHRPRQIQLTQVLGHKHALISDIVNGKHTLHIHTPSGQISRRQAGLPIVGVQHIGLTPCFVHTAGQRRCCPAEQAEADHVVAVVEIVLVVVRVAAAVIQMRRIHKIKPHALIIGIAHHHMAAEGVACGHFDGVGKRFAHLAVIRQHHAHIIASLLLGKGKRAQHIGQAAGFDERIKL